MKRTGYRRTTWLVVMMACFLCATSHAFPTLVGIRLVSPDGTVLLSFKQHEVVTKNGTYTVQRWGENRLKLIEKSTRRGVFLKRFGIKLMIRDLKGNLLHIIRKEGRIYRVESPVGAHLMFIKIANGTVTVFREEGSPLYTLTPQSKAVVMKDKGGKLVYTLKGDTDLYPASFLCIPELTWEERAACYLLYKTIPFADQ